MSTAPLTAFEAGDGRWPLRALRLVVAASSACVASTASAHAFALPYNLPVPVGMYALGASVALLLSFGVVALSMTRPAALRTRSHEPPSQAVRQAAPHLSVARLVGLFLLVLTIATGFAGTRNAFQNWNMTFFWIVFVLGVAYAVALMGNFYAAFNPWKALVDVVAAARLVRFGGRLSTQRAHRLGRYPALVLYMGFIWVELFARAGPRGLSVALLAYTVINVVGAWLLGRANWFRQGEFFSIVMCLLGRMSPRSRQWCGADSNPARGWRAPFVGLLDRPADEMSLVVFIMFMMSSTAFDGLHETTPWASLFWAHLYPWLEPLFPATGPRKFAISAELYNAWQWCAMAALPFVYLAVYALFVAAVKLVARTRRSVRELMLRFALTLVPIAFVYHVTHYYTLLLSQGAQIVKLASDPFGYGWNLFGTATVTIDPILVDASVIWHTQVALIVAGHIVSVYLAHVEAVRIFETPRRAALSQIPMLLLMMLFTSFGLWILSLPLGPA